MPASVQRLAAAVRRHGVAGAARHAAGRLRPVEPVDAQVVWYLLDLTDPDRPRRPLTAELDLRRATRDDVPLLAQLPPDPAISTLDADELEGRLQAGGTLWIVTEGDRTAFACWTFRGRAPMFGAPGGTIALPADTALLEDSISSPDFRGRGVAPGAWTGIADALAAEGLAWMATKVGVENVPSRRAVEKAGFRDVGRMRTQRRLWFTRIRVDLRDAGPGAWLRDLARN